MNINNRNTFLNEMNKRLINELEKIIERNKKIKKLYLKII